MEMRHCSSDIFVVGSRVWRWSGCNQTYSCSCSYLRPELIADFEYRAAWWNKRRERLQLQGRWAHLEFVTLAVFHHDNGCCPCSHQPRLIPHTQESQPRHYRSQIWSRHLLQRLCWPGEVPPSAVTPPLSWCFRQTSVQASQLAAGAETRLGGPRQRWFTWLSGGGPDRDFGSLEKTHSLFRERSRVKISFHFGLLFCKMGIRLACQVCFQDCMW